MKIIEDNLVKFIFIFFKTEIFSSNVHKTELIAFCSVIEGKEIQFSQIIPSVYLKSMTDLYANMQFDNVVKLARLALEHSGNIDKKIQHEIQYLLCLALAKQKS